MNEKYLKTKEGSIEDTVKLMQNKVLESDYQDKFKKALDKEGKPLGHMTGAEKKAFFGKVDKMHTAKNEEKDIPKGSHKMPDGTIMKDSEHKKEVKEEDAYDGTPAEVKKLKAKEKADAEKAKAKSKKEEVNETHTTQTAKANAHQRTAGGEKSPISHMVNKSIEEITSNDAKTFAQMRAEMDEACWDSHKQVGTKQKGGKQSLTVYQRMRQLKRQTLNEHSLVKTRRSKVKILLTKARKNKKLAKILEILKRKQCQVKLRLLLR